MQDSSYGVPIGTVIAWTLETPPLGLHGDHWLECNGQPVDSNKYPRLAELMSNVPDYTGMFLRGRGGNADSLGVKQGDTARPLKGDPGEAFVFSGNLVGIESDSPFYTTSNTPTVSVEAWYYDGFEGLKTYRYQLSGDKDNGYKLEESSILRGVPTQGWQYKARFDVSRSWPISNEFRPVNKSVRYMIKAK